MRHVTTRVLAVSAIVAALSSSILQPAQARQEGATPSAIGGTEQVTVRGTTPGAALALSGPGDVSLAATADDSGNALFLQVPPGEGYTVTAAGQPVGQPVTVLDPQFVPAASTYTSQTIGSGFGYVATRDGTLLSVNVVLPGPVENGPYPTVIEYNGYQPSNPANADFARVYTSRGYAYVGVNMRGTGCSGGVFGLFDTNNALDGYDVIETISAQSWVKNHGVGLVGISYGGISQLFVAATRPPNLRAITPLSVLDDGFRSNSYPGGMLNTGFTVGWLGDRFRESASFGQEWTQAKADGGDFVCAANQELRGLHQDLVKLGQSDPFFPGAGGEAARIIAADLVDQINVPVFIGGAWQDEQTGGRFATMLDKFTSAPVVAIELTNGGHTDSLNPVSLGRYMEFLDLYVADRVPSLADAQLVAPLLAGTLYGADDVPTYTDRFAGMTVADAKRTFEADPSVRILLESGAAPGATPGAALPNAILQFPSWPIPTATATRFNLGEQGTLTPAESAGAPAAPASGTDSYRADTSALPATNYHGNSTGIWQAKVEWDWQPLPAGTGVGYRTAPLTADTFVAGSGSVDLWINPGSATDTDLEVTITEIRPDGTEIYVQSGWLRASQRALDAAQSTELRPVHTHERSVAAPLPANEFTLARVELYPVAHAFRAGSSIRLTIDAPGNNRPIWEFESLSNNETVTIAHDAAHPSSVVLSIVPGVVLPAAPPACDSLRGQPCRVFVAASNGG